MLQGTIGGGSILRTILYSILRLFRLSTHKKKKYGKFLLIQSYFDTASKQQHLKAALKEKWKYFTMTALISELSLKAVR